MLICCALSPCMGNARMLQCTDQGASAWGPARHSSSTSLAPPAVWETCKTSHASHRQSLSCCRDAAMASRCNNPCCTVCPAALPGRAGTAQGANATSIALTIELTSGQRAAGQHSTQPVQNASGRYGCASLVPEGPHLHIWTR